MKLFFLLFLPLFLTACSSPRPKFKKENVCSYEALRYLRNPRNVMKTRRPSPQLIQEMTKTSRNMQLCYEDFRLRSGVDEFNTCLVVGIDDAGETEFYNFGSNEVELDEQFIRCARSVTQNVPYSAYGTNYILIQSYQFYVGGK